MTALFVDSRPALVELCARLRDRPWLALDTEFIRERTFYPRLCLVQVAHDEVVACVDALALDDLDPLLNVLYDPAVIKVLHSAHQDLEIFFYRRGEVPCPVFDTQIAAAVLGHGEYVGYATLVNDLLGVELDKSQTRTDWSRRPLAEAQLRYAADDVHYLCEVYRLQRAELVRGDRLARLERECAALCDPARYQVHPEEAWRRIKAGRRLRGTQLAVLQTLAAWREEQARAADLPRNWVLGNEVLVTLARRMPGDWESLRRVPGLKPSTLRRYGDVLLQRITAARVERP